MTKRGVKLQTDNAERQEGEKATRMSAGCGLIMHCPALPRRQTCSECAHYRPFAARRRICQPCANAQAQACRSHASHKRLSAEGQCAPVPSPLKRARSDQGEAAASLTAVIAPLPSASTASRTESVTCVPQREQCWHMRDKSLTRWCCGALHRLGSAAAAAPLLTRPLQPLPPSPQPSRLHGSRPIGRSCLHS